jgi:adenosylcobinamide kinase / adenosylcobinamide-phosphate guanylyltransferase
MFTLILGGARSGKSRFAQSLCQDAAMVVYIATARVEDAEMRERVERHRAERPSHWRTLEEPLALAEAVRSEGPATPVILIDCLTVWLSNLMWELREQPSAAVEAVINQELNALAAAAGTADIVAVSNEVGSGVVPESPAGRTFRDLQGLLNQRAAALADRVFLTVAGIAIPIKTPLIEVRSNLLHHE